MRIVVASALLAGTVAVATTVTGVGAGAAPPTLEAAKTATLAATDSGPEAVWHMDEGAGATVMVDSSPSGQNNGSIHGVTTGTPGLVSGNSYTFDGARSYVEVPDNDSLDPGNNPTTVTATVRAQNVPMPDDSYDLVRKGLSTAKGGYWKMEILRAAKNPSVGRLHCTFKGVMPNGKKKVVKRVAQVDLIDGKTHTVQCIMTPTAVHAVVDGRVFTTEKPTGSINNNASVVLGAKEPDDDVLLGSLDEVSIDIDTPDTPAQPPTPKPGVVAQWHMDEAAGATVMEDSASLGGSNDGTIHGVTTGVAGLVSGKAYTFDGSRSYVEVPDNDSLDPGNSPITLTATVRAQNVPMPDDSYDLVRKGYSTTKGGDWKMEIKRASNHSVGRLHCVFAGVMPNGKKKAVKRVAQVDIIDGKTHTVQCIRTASAIHAVVDGRVFTNAKVTGHISNNQPVVVGAKKPDDDVLLGTLDEVSVQIG